MITLGVSGWHEGGHAASAVLLKNGIPLVMIEEERVTRIKRSEDTPPTAAIYECLSVSGVSWADVDCVAHGYDINETYATVGRTLELPVIDYLIPPELLKEHRPKFVKVKHHLAHAASAFLCSDWSQATIVVVDGTGESESTTIFKATTTGIEEILSIPTSLSLGFFYQAATFVAGLGPGAEGKLMGLASYGNPDLEFQPFGLVNGSITLPGSEGVGRFVGQNFRKDLEPILTWWNERLQPMVANAETIQDRSSFAATVQAELERVLFYIVDTAIRRTGIRDVIITGGVGLNCSFNGNLAKSGLIKRLLLSPVAADMGVSLGAALYAEHSAGHDKRWIMSHAYLGRSWTNKEVESARQLSGFEKGEVMPFPALCNRLAKELASGKIIGWFDGNAEVGPRALGARSILADPRDRGMTDKVNDVKGRERWRPLAPSVLQSHFNQFFEGAGRSDYMLMALKATALGAQATPATTHVDGTARPQSVWAHTNPRFMTLLENWKEKSGVPVLLNTSFNLAGEPIVHSPQDAFRSFAKSDIDLLCINGHLFHK